MGQRKSKESWERTQPGECHFVKANSLPLSNANISALLLQIITTLSLFGAAEEFKAPNMTLSGTNAKTFSWNDPGIDFRCRTFMSFLKATQ
jgi:hypothetical protein